ncbi:MAG: carboxyltransferase domain-containing protein [Acidimicrobiales bacterium]
MVGRVPTRSVPVGEIRPFGERALLIGVEDPPSARSLARALLAARMDGLAEVVGGLATVMVAFDDDGDELDSRLPVLTRLVEDAIASPADVSDGGGVVVLSCAFDGPDLAEVADMVGCTAEGVVELVTSQTLTVAMVGFSPGFAYLTGLPEQLRHIPRRLRPRPAVNAGSVALANGYAAVYPTASPGGWQLIGQTHEPLFTPSKSPYARLAAGDRVRFERATGRSGGGSSPVLTPHLVPPTLTSPVRNARPIFVVEDSGFRTVLQDGGRRHMAALGVPAAGPADPYSFRLANRLVGNAAEAVALEATARGPTLRCLDATFVAAVGASPDLRLQGQPVAAGRVVPVGAGQRLALGPIRDGIRSYVAVAGGLVGPELLGSCATDQLCALGPGPITSGQRLYGGGVTPPLGDHLRDGTSSGWAGGEPVVLRVVPGPHAEAFASGAFASLGTMGFTVADESNRVGLRLRRDPQGPAVVRAPGTFVELDSQGMVHGAVQLPPDGDPVILLSDHATLGGYPVVAVVASVDHGRLGQCAPGMAVVLVPIDGGQAAAARKAQRRAMEAAVVGRYPLAVE